MASPNGWRLQPRDCYQSLCAESPGPLGHLIGVRTALIELDLGRQPDTCGGVEGKCPCLCHCSCLPVCIGIEDTQKQLWELVCLHASPLHTGDASGSAGKWRRLRSYPKVCSEPLRPPVSDLQTEEEKLFSQAPEPCPLSVPVILMILAKKRKGRG